LKIVFVETPSPWLVRRNMHVSLGPLYLATILKREGYDVRVARPENVEDFVDFKDADIICMSGTTLEYPINVECAKWMKEHYPEIRIFLGGSHATAMWSEIWGGDLFDSICVGEGESVILDMVKDIERGHCVPGCVYGSNGFIKDINEIPFPDRTLIEGDYGKDVFLNRKNYNNGGSESIITSRGCSFSCAFCASHSMWNGQTRYRSIDNIVSEIKQIIKTTGKKQFSIWDDNFTLNKRRCLKLCDALGKLDIAWSCLVRADSLDLEICEAMYNAGCKEIRPGIESGDQRVLDCLNKQAKVEKMFVGCSNAKKAGLKIRVLFMIGTPGEMIDTPEINKAFIDRLDFDLLTLSTFTPLPGSPIWDDPKKYNCKILSTDFRKYNQYPYEKINGKKIKKEYEPLIHNEILSTEQMRGNVERMATYVKETGKFNRG